MPGQAGPCRVKHMPATGGQPSALLYRRALPPVPAGQRPHAVCSAARHALQPAPLRVRCPFSRVHAALSYALTGKGPIPHFSAARHVLQPASLRVRCPFSRVHAALSYALTGKGPIPHFSAARHVLQPASLRVRCPFSRVHAALSYAFAGRTHYTRKYAQSPPLFIGNGCKAVRRKYT